MAEDRSLPADLFKDLAEDTTPPSDPRVLLGPLKALVNAHRNLSPIDIDAIRVGDEWCTLCFKVEAKHVPAVKWLRRRDGHVGHCGRHLTRGSFVGYDDAKADEMLVQDIMER